ncbi:MAG: peptidylprolyl isomerase, partial [Myxococcota bacterium]
MNHLGNHTRRSWAASLGVIALVATVACNGPATTAAIPGAMPDPGETVLTVDEHPIGLSELEIVFEKRNVPEAERATFAWTPNGKKLSEEYAVAVALYEQAVAAKLYDDPEVRLQLQLAERQVLAGAMREKLAKAAVTDAAIQKYYDDNKPRFDKTEVKARHIVVGSETEANEIKAQLASGVDFATLAKTKSIDKKTAAKGGDVGWFHLHEERNFGDKVFEEKPGTVVGPIESRMGFHVVEVLDRRANTPLEEVKPEAAAQLEHAESTRIVDELRKNMKVAWVKEPDPGEPTIGQR